MTPRRSRLPCIAALFALLLAVGVPGCKRAFWRDQADRQVYDILATRTADPRWDVPRFDVQPNPASRMFDPFDPDKPPLPPDDPTARQLMAYPGGFRGSREYQKMGEVLFNDNPDWRTPFPPVGEQSLEARIESTIPEEKRLTLEELVELSYLHSRNYQTQIETLYLSALDLTFDRFLFTLRYRGLSGLEPGGDLEYENVPDTADNLRARSRFGLRKLLPTGTQLIVELANDTLWLFSGPNQTNTMSLASYSIVKPLLLGAGRKIVLEDLTQSERNVLYAARDLARFRRTFFVDTVSGGQSGGLLGLLQRRQLILNLMSNIDELDLQVRVLTELQSRPPSEFRTELRSTAAPLREAEVPASLKGKLQLDEPEERGREDVELVWTLPMSTEEAEELARFAEDVFRDDRPTARYVLGRLQEDVIGPAREEHFVEFEDSLEGSLGIEPGEPLPEVEIVVAGRPRKVELARFGRYERIEQAGQGYELVWYGPMLLDQEQALLALSDDPAYTSVVERLAVASRARQSLDIAQLTSRLLNSQNALRAQEQAYRDALDRYKIELGLPPDVLLPIDECLLEQFQLIDSRLSSTAYARVPGLEQRLVNFVELAYDVDVESPSVTDVRRIVTELTALVEDVRVGGFQLVEGDLARLRDELPKVRARLRTPEERERLQRDVERDLRRFDVLQTAFNGLRAELAQLAREAAAEDVTDERLTTVVTELRSIREEALKLVRELKVVQIGARLEQIELPEFDLTLDRAVEIAVENRLDLMNTRAQVVDARRQVEITANRLEALLDVRAEGDVRNSPNRENPFDFRGARSSFRVGVAFAAPLDRQAERNDYRASLIALQQAKRAYTLAEDEVKFDIRQSWRRLQILRENFEVSRQALRFAAAQLDQAAENALEPLRSGQSSRGAGSQGLNLLNALNAVLNAQNDIIGNWVSYESARLNLFRDMGIMEVDARGLWDDPFYQGLSEQCRRSRTEGENPQRSPSPDGPEWCFPTSAGPGQPVSSPAGPTAARHRDVEQPSDGFVLPTPTIPRVAGDGGPPDDDGRLRVVEPGWVVRGRRDEQPVIRHRGRHEPPAASDRHGTWSNRQP